MLTIYTINRKTEIYIYMFNNRSNITGLIKHAYLFIYLFTTLIINHLYRKRNELMPDMWVLQEMLLLFPKVTSIMFVYSD